MIKDIIQQTDPVQAKAIASGVGTLSIFGMSIPAEQIDFWMGVGADFGVIVASLTTAYLTVQSIRNARKDKK